MMYPRKFEDSEVVDVQGMFDPDTVTLIGYHVTLRDDEGNYILRHVPVDRLNVSEMTKRGLRLRYIQDTTGLRIVNAPQQYLRRPPIPFTQEEARVAIATYRPRPNIARERKQARASTTKRVQSLEDMYRSKQVPMPPSLITRQARLSLQQELCEELQKETPTLLYGLAADLGLDWDQMWRARMSHKDICEAVSRAILETTEVPQPPPQRLRIGREPYRRRRRTQAAAAVNGPNAATRRPPRSRAAARSQAAARSAAPK